MNTVAECHYYDFSLWHLNFLVFRKHFQHSHMSFSITNLRSLVSLEYYITNLFQKHHPLHIVHLLSRRQNHPSQELVSHTAVTCKKQGSSASLPISSHSHLLILTLNTLLDDTLQCSLP